MNIEHIKEFIILANCLSFSDAAKLTYTSKPSLSRHIRQLEKELGYQLFERNSHGSVLTRKGQEFFQKIEPLVIDFEKVIAPFAENKDYNKLVVGMNYAEAFDELHTYVKSFINDHPETNIELKNTRHHNFPELLFTGKIDVALEQYTDAHVHKNISCINLKRQKFMVAHEASRDLSKNPINIKTLPDEQIFIPDRADHPGAREIIGIIENNNKIKLEHVIEKQSVEIMMAEVSLGKGIAVVPEAYRMIAPRDVALTHFPGLPTRPITALFLNNSNNPDIAKFVSYLIKISK